MRKCGWKLLGSPRVGTLPSHCWGPGFEPRSGTKIPQVRWHGLKRERECDKFHVQTRPKVSVTEGWNSRETGCSLPQQWTEDVELISACSERWGNSGMKRIPAAYQPPACSHSLWWAPRKLRIWDTCPQIYELYIKEITSVSPDFLIFPYIKKSLNSLPWHVASQAWSPQNAHLIKHNS